MVGWDQFSNMQPWNMHISGFQPFQPNQYLQFDTEDYFVNQPQTSQRSQTHTFGSSEQSTEDVPTH